MLRLVVGVHLRSMSTQNDEEIQPEPPLVDLPLAVVNVGEMGTVSATFDGVDVPPPVDADHWSRERFGQLLDALTQERTRSIRLEVRESDGRVFTEIIYSRRGATNAPITEETQSVSSKNRRARRGRPPRLFEITGSGFIPGEDILVAVPFSTAEGNESGVTRAIVDLDQLLSHANELALIGYVSGRIVTKQLP